MTEVERQDRRQVVTLALLLIGGATVLGSLMGLAYGMARDILACVCCGD